jgi:hypothetical protein
MTNERQLQLRSLRLCDGMLCQQMLQFNEMKRKMNFCWRIWCLSNRSEQQSRRRRRRQWLMPPFDIDWVCFSTADGTPSSYLYYNISPVGTWADLARYLRVSFKTSATKWWWNPTVGRLTSHSIFPLAHWKLLNFDDYLWRSWIKPTISSFCWLQLGCCAYFSN